MYDDSSIALSPPNNDDESEDPLPERAPTKPPSPPTARSRSKEKQPISSRLRSKSAHLSATYCDYHPYLQILYSHISQLDSSPSNPLTHRATPKPPFATEWAKAEHEELLDSLFARHVWKLVPRTHNANIVSNKWVFKTKEDNEGKSSRRKARLVARGFTQIKGINYEEIFSPTAKFVTVRLIVALSTSLNWPIDQADIDTAFLRADIDKDIYMQ